MYDQDTEQAMTAVQLVDDAQIERWFTAICAAYANGGSDWSSVKDELTATAAQFDSSFDSPLVESFLAVAERLGNPLATIADLERIGVADLARAYPVLLAQARSGADVDAADPATLSWMTEAQRRKFESAAGGSWPELVREALDSKYPPWRSAQTADLQKFLDDWGDHIVAEHVPPAPPAASEAETLAWLTDAQRNKFEGAAGGSWPELVREALDSEYPLWRSAQAADLQKFLDDWGDHIVAEQVPPAFPEPESHGAPLTADEPPDQPAAEAGQVSDERLETFRALADDPAVEGIDRETLDELLHDPDFDQRLAEAEALVDAALADAES
ncbi:hypothetical protein [Kribbella sp. DT2]|uniref:hypothetical protein n=1 Tax=Kribbella sp. DT2 TaxID=3393427 RepID=UPI003CE7399A